MSRVNYDYNKYDIQLDHLHQEQDAARLQLELEMLGQLYFNQDKDNKKFNDYILDIEKSVIAECQKIYNTTPNLQKLLLGNDKVPDYLRGYL